MSEKYEHRPADGVEADNYDATRDPDYMMPTGWRTMQSHYGHNDANPFASESAELHKEIAYLRAEIERLKAQQSPRPLAAGDVVLVSEGRGYRTWNAGIFDGDASPFRRGTTIVRMDCSLEDAATRVGLVRAEYDKKRAALAAAERAEIIALGQLMWGTPE